MRTELRHQLTTLGRRVRVSHTVRLRLTVLYGGLFAASGAALLTITYLLVSHFAAQVRSITRHGPLTSARSASRSSAQLPPLPSLAALQRRAQHALVSQHNNDLHQLLVWSLVALAGMTVASIMLGWLFAGRVLRPLQTMTRATRRISQNNLQQRLALGGPDDELRQLADTIDELLARLQTAFDAQQRFVANASHELRTPLARIRTALDVAVGKPGPRSPQVTALDRKVREGLDRADTLLESFLTLSRAEHGEVAERSVVRFDEIVRAALVDHEPEIAAKRIEVEHDLRAVTLTGSRTLISRMVENVIDNGARHNVPDGSIRITLDDHGDHARLTVESSGPPLDPSRVSELVQPFRRIGAERTGSDRGAGLGLSIVNAIAAAHKGTVELQARNQGGLRVVIHLPHEPDTNGSGPAK
jgi:signal transduction histidine kinase